MTDRSKKFLPRMLVAGLLPALAIAACSRAIRAPAPGSAGPAIRPYAAADARFMTGMIGHHAQAVLMAGWAPSHGASPAVRTLCERIVVGQGDEIALMQRWLRDRHQPVPAADGAHHMMMGMEPMGLMPGMLTPEQLAQLDAASGPAFDRLFLTFMIQHHRGALIMVDQLFGSQGAGEEEAVFRFASDVSADQTTEIDRMQKMLAALPPDGHSP